MRNWSHYQPALVKMGQAQCILRGVSQQWSHRKLCSFLHQELLHCKVKHDFVKLRALVGKMWGNGKRYILVLIRISIRRLVTFQIFPAAPKESHEFLPSLVVTTLRNKPLHHSPNLFTSGFVVGLGNQQKVRGDCSKFFVFFSSPIASTNPHPSLFCSESATKPHSFIILVFSCCRMTMSSDLAVPFSCMIPRQNSEIVISPSSPERISKRGPQSRTVILGLIQGTIAAVCHDDVKFQDEMSPKIFIQHS